MLETSQDLQATVEGMLRHLQHWPSLQGAAIWLPAERLFMLARFGSAGLEIRRLDREPATHSLLDRALSTGAASAASADDGYPVPLGRGQALLVAPLLLDGEVLGALALEADSPDCSPGAAQALACQMAIAVQAARERVALQLIRAQDAGAHVQFVSNVAHELRTPMTSIKGYTDMLLAGMIGELSEPQRRFLSIIKVNADRLGVLVENLLEVSRLDAGRVRLELAAVPVSQVIGEAIAALQGELTAKKVSCSTALPEAMPPVAGDASRLAQVMTHLLTNACHYTPEGGSIRVGATLCPQEGPEPAHLQVDVADTGIGITPEEQPRVFQRFFRGDHDVVREQMGTGLGLCIVRGLVELHGGRIWFRSEPGRGTTFSFTLPVASPA